jgi:hypothetical protein
MYEITIKANNVSELNGAILGLAQMLEKSISSNSVAQKSDAKETVKEPKETLPWEEKSESGSKPKVSFEKLRALMAELTRSNMREGVKKILQDYKAERLTELQEKDYDGAYQKALQLKEGAA